MRRPIKFRIPHFNRDGSFYGFSYWGAIDHHGVVIDTHDCFGSPAYIYSTSKGWHDQFTGRKDKNDREVFEGDIYRIEEETDGLDEVFYVVVIWIDEWSMFASVLLEEYHRYKVGGAKELDEQLFWTYNLNDINSPKHFYCGDIYQNPDLLQC